jgi:hypothetical protein
VLVEPAPEVAERYRLGLFRILTVFAMPCCAVPCAANREDAERAAQQQAAHEARVAAADAKKRAAQAAATQKMLQELDAQVWLVTAHCTLSSSDALMKLAAKAVGPFWEVLA